MLMWRYCSFVRKNLEEKGFGVVLNVSGWKGQQSHAWLELVDIYIDITADQFIEIDKSVIITKRSHFHEKFRHIQK